MHTWVVIGRTASASAEFSLTDLASTSGRLDVLVRCVRAAFLVSHGVRRDTILYLVLLGGERAPRVVRIDGARVRFLRPDERSLATLLKKTLAHADDPPDGLVEVRAGVSIGRGGLEAVLADLPAAPRWVLDDRGEDVRTAPIDPRRAVIFVGDHLGLDEIAAERIRAEGAIPISIGPTAVHADDAIAITHNELDRRAGAL